MIIPAALASGALHAGETTELVAYLTARALDSDGCSMVRRTALAFELGSILGERQIRATLNGEKARRYFAPEGRYFRLRSQAMIVASFEQEVLPRSDAIGLPLRLLNSRARRGAAMLAAVLATAQGKPRSHCFISRFTGVDKKTIYRWLRDPIVSEHMLRRSPTWIRASRKRRPNRWIVPAWREGRSKTLQLGLGSHMGKADRSPQGIRQLKRIYYETESEMVRYLHELQRQGVDIRREVLRVGELLVGAGRELQPYYPEDILRLLGISAAGLPHH